MPHEMTGATAHRQRTLLLKAALLLLAVTPWGACGDGEPLVTSEAPLVPVDPLIPPSDSLPLDSVPVPPDTIVPPPDSGVDSTVVPPGPDPDPMGPPPDSVAPIPPPEHVGIPFGPYHLPPLNYGPRFSGTLLASHPLTVLADLEAARRAGARVMLGLVGSERRLRGSDGHFSLAVWERRVDRYRSIDISSYIEDGTIIAHYIMDEPHDPTNWGGRTVPRADVDEMAKYSKQIWPSLPTVIRGWPDYLKGYQYKYLDAAWAQYSDRFGDIDQFISNNVRDARSAGLGLVVGLNLLAGGDRTGIKGFYADKYAMSASQVRQWGNKLLDEGYICAFISWKYDPDYFSRSGITSALEDLNEKARSRPKKACSNTN
ncbi:MAG: hypothetical protein ABI037_10365 [Gemmatimonadales bacterium]